MSSCPRVCAFSYNRKILVKLRWLQWQFLFFLPWRDDCNRLFLRMSKYTNNLPMLLLYQFPIFLNNLVNEFLLLLLPLVVVVIELFLGVVVVLVFVVYW